MAPTAPAPGATAVRSWKESNHDEGPTRGRDAADAENAAEHAAHAGGTGANRGRGPVRWRPGKGEDDLPQPGEAGEYRSESCEFSRHGPRHARRSGRRRGQRCRPPRRGNLAAENGEHHGRDAVAAGTQVAVLIASSSLASLLASLIVSLSLSLSLRHFDRATLIMPSSRTLDVQQAKIDKRDSQCA